MNGFDLAKTLDSGQFFRWRRENGGFRFVTGGRLHEAPPFDDEASRFLALDHDIGHIDEELRLDTRLHPILNAGRGIRILRQDPWECIVSFVASMVSNIPRISGFLEKLCRELGTKLDEQWWAVPGPDRIQDEQLLRRLGLGFRAKYLAPIGREVEGGVLQDLPELSTDEIRKRLCALPGIGPKVADCILLFAFGRLESFPIDVWIRRIMTELYFNGRRPPGGDDTIRRFAQDHFGRYAGYAQQFLYVWCRLR